MLLTEIQVQNIKMFLQVTLLSLEKLICDNDLILVIEQTLQGKTLIAQQIFNC